MRDLAVSDTGHTVTPATAAMLEQLEAADWFYRVGEPVDRAGVRVAGSWEEADRRCESRRWRDVQIRRSNDLTVLLHQFWRGRYQRWNEIAREARPAVDSLVTRKLEKVLGKDAVPHWIGHAARWDVIHACFESEYSDIVPPAFFTDLLRWYLGGRFPCDWEDGGGQGGGTLWVY